MIKAYQNYSSVEFIALLSEKETLLSEKENRISKLEERIAWFERQVFGKKSEKFPVTPEEQLPLAFDNVETIVELPSEKITVTYKREKKKKNENHPGRHAIPAHIERVVIEIHPEGDLSGMECIGKREREVLERIPGKFIVNHYVLYTYKKIETGAIVEGKLPSLPIEKGIPGAGILAFILVNKFFYHLPLHRQLEIFKNEAGMIIKASTISGWVGQCCKLLLLLYDKLLKHILSQSYLMVDETPIKVLMKTGNKTIILGYLWAYYSPLTKSVFFDYRSGRGAENPSRILKNFKGHIQTDGYSAYKSIVNPDIIFLNCMAHARRKFIDAKDNNAGLANYFIIEVQKLYRIEKQAGKLDLSYDDRFTLRKKRSEPVLSGLKKWLDENVAQTTPSSLIGKAMRYALNHWAGLTKYLTDGRLEIDNNAVERAIRLVAMGRKNYMFAGSEEGAKWLAMMYSFYGTCKAQGVEPFEWTKTTLEKMPDYDPKLIDELLPFLK